MQVSGKLQNILSETLSLLRDYDALDEACRHSSDELPTLLLQCQELCDALKMEAAEPVRTLHHFACAGGTLISRCIGAQPNTLMLSEVDPISPLNKKSYEFTPTDPIRLALLNLRPLSNSTLEEMFVGSIKAIHENSVQIGRALVLRDHTHSHFCTEADPGGRDIIRDVLRRHFAVKSLVTVRHPADSYLSMQLNHWVNFQPATLEEYCRRYLLFLQAYEDTPVVHYENFVTDPDCWMQNMTEILELSYADNWQQWLPLVRLTGDSGRKGDKIELRPRRKISPEIAREAEQSATYSALCDRLGYAKSLDVAALPHKILS